MERYALFCREIFAEVLNMSLIAGVVIVFVLLARLLLKRAPKIFSYALWAAVLFRLLCPVSISSQVSLLGVFDMIAGESSNVIGSEYLWGDIAQIKYPEEMVSAKELNLEMDDEALRIQGTLVSDSAEQTSSETVSTTAEVPVMALKTLIENLAYIWLAGVLTMLLYGILSYEKLRRKLTGALHLCDNIYLADHIASPFVIGLLRPRIYLLSSLPEKEQEYVIQHERHHIHRLDHIVKVLAFTALSIHWFNPLVWAAFVLLGKDMEMSCDEAVVRKLGEDIRADYSLSLLSLATRQRILSGAPLAFGEGDTKGRIRNLANWKKPKVWVCVLAAVLSIFVIAAGAVNPKKSQVPQLNFGDIYNRETEPAGKDALEAAVSAAILEQDNSGVSDGLLHCESHIIFDTESTRVAPSTVGGEYRQKVTVYALVLNMHFGYSGASFHDQGGSHIPTAITFEVNEAGEYTLVEYWLPKDGAYYESSIREKFPNHIEEEVMDTQKYILWQMQDCYHQAVQYGDVDTDTVVGGLLEELQHHLVANNSFVSNERIYEEAHDNYAQYRELIYYGKYTLEYCFKEFTKGGQKDLRGFLMASFCRDIMSGFGEDMMADMESANGQEWFDILYQIAGSMEQRYTEDEMQNDYPIFQMVLEVGDGYVPEAEKRTEGTDEIDWQEIMKRYVDQEKKRQYGN